MTDDLQRAVEAARRLIAIDEGEPDAGDEIEYLDAVVVARALLSILSTRDDVIEECAKVADALVNEAKGDAVATFEPKEVDRHLNRVVAYREVAKAIRSLKSSTAL